MTREHHAGRRQIQCFTCADRGSEILESAGWNRVIENSPRYERLALHRRR
jgi:hypothetical protein